MDYESFARFLRAMVHLHEWSVAINAVSLPTAAMGLFGFLGDSRRNDDEIAEANEFCIDMLGNGDNVSVVEGATGRNLRDQITVEEVEAMAEDADRRRHGWLWN